MNKKQRDGRQKKSIKVFTYKMRKLKKEDYLEIIQKVLKAKKSLVYLQGR